MKFKIHYTLKGNDVTGDVDDYFTVEGDTIEEIRDAANAETKRRNLDEN